jgi:peroxiredoxin
MTIARPRLLAASLAVAVVVSIIGAVLWAQWVGGDDDGNDAGTDAIPTNADVEGEQLPEATLTDRDGEELSSSDLLGSPLVLNFWFSTCPPCAKELPDFASVHAELGDDVRFVGINTVDSVEVMERFAGERGVTYELYRDEFAELTDGIGAAAFPITVFVTSDGTIVEQTGVLDAEQLRTKIGELLEADVA